MNGSPRMNSLGSRQASVYHGRQRSYQRPFLLCLANVIMSDTENIQKPIAPLPTDQAAPAAEAAPAPGPSGEAPAKEAPGKPSGPPPRGNKPQGKKGGGGQGGERRRIRE